MAMLTTDNGMKVTIEFRQEVHSRDGKSWRLEPQSVSFVFGVERQAPSLEEAIRGLAPGESFQVTIPPDELFGAYDPDLVRDLPREDYREERLAVGRVYREMRRRELVQFKVMELREGVVVADFNDERAGAYSFVEGRVTDVVQPTDSEMKAARKRAHVAAGGCAP